MATTSTKEGQPSPPFPPYSLPNKTPSYEPYEPEFEDEEPFSPHDPDDYEGAAQTPGAPGGTDDPDAQVPATNGVHGGRTVVEVNGEGGPQQQQVKKNAVVGMKDKKVPTEKRSTTPYMTKYERARVLGTRALQIRYVLLGGRW